MLQTGFASGFRPLGSGLESDSKKLESEHLWWILSAAQAWWCEARKYGCCVLFEVTTKRVTQFSLMDLSYPWTLDWGLWGTLTMALSPYKRWTCTWQNVFRITSSHGKPMGCDGTTTGRHGMRDDRKKCPMNKSGNRYSCKMFLIDFLVYIWLWNRPLQT